MPFVIFSQGISPRQLEPSPSKRGIMKADSTAPINWFGQTRYRYKHDSITSSGGSSVNISTTSPILGGPITGTGTISIQQSSTSTSGYLSAANFAFFNSKKDSTTAGNTTTINLTESPTNQITANLNVNSIDSTFIKTNGIGNTDIAAGVVTPNKLDRSYFTGTGFAGRFAIFANANTLYSDPGLIYDFSSKKLGVGYSTSDSTNLQSDLGSLATGIGLKSASTSTGFSLRSSSAWWQLYQDNNRFALWSNSDGGSDKFTINYSSYQPFFKYFDTGVAAAAGDRVNISTSTGNMKALTAGTTGQVFTQTATGPAWVAAAGVSSVALQTGNNAGLSLGGTSTNPTLGIVAGASTGQILKYTSGSGWAAGTEGDAIIGNEVVGATGNGLATTGTGTAVDPYNITLAGKVAQLANLNYGSANQVLTSNGTNALSWTTPSGGSGTVTSVTGGNGLYASVNPITTSGTIHNLQSHFGGLVISGSFNQTSISTSYVNINFSNTIQFDNSSGTGPSASANAVTGPTDDITINQAGTYEVYYNLNYVPTLTTTTTSFGLHINGVLAREVLSYCVTNNSDNISDRLFITLFNADKVTLKVKTQVASPGTTIQFQYPSLTVKKLY